MVDQKPTEATTIRWIASEDRDRPFAKVWKSGVKQNVEFPWLCVTGSCALAGLADLYRFLEHARENHHLAVVRSELRDDIPETVGEYHRIGVPNEQGHARVWRTVHPQPDGRPACFRPSAKQWFCVDFDVINPTKLDFAQDPAGCAREMRALLPYELRNAECIWQASGSAGLKPGIRLHLWFWGDRPTEDRHLQAWFRGLTLNSMPLVDLSVFGTAHLIYTAKALLHDTPDPMSARIGVLSGAPVVLPDELPTATAPLTHALPTVSDVWIGPDVRVTREMCAKTGNTDIRRLGTGDLGVGRGAGLFNQRLFILALQLVQEFTPGVTDESWLGLLQPAGVGQAEEREASHALRSAKACVGAFDGSWDRDQVLLRRLTEIGVVSRLWYTEARGRELYEILPHTGKKARARQLLRVFLRLRGADRALEKSEVPEVLAVLRKGFSQGIDAESLLPAFGGLAGIEEIRDGLRRPNAPRSELEFTESALALRFVKMFEPELRVVKDGWWRYDGQRWAPISGLPTPEATRLVQSLRDELNAEVDEDLDKMLKAKLDGGPLRSLASLAMGLPELCVAFSEFDNEPYLLNCPNGTLDLRNGQLREHSYKDLITKMTGADYDPTARCPTWLTCLDLYSCGDPEWVSWLQWLLSRCLVGHVEVALIPLFTGAGGNGKSTTLDAVGHALGSYVGAVPSAAFGDNSHSSVWGGLSGKRLVRSNELDPRKALDMTKLKAMCSTDPIQVQPGMGRNFVTMIPSWRLIGIVNGTPRITSQGDAETRRVRVLPWRWSYKQGGGVGRPEEALKAEAVGILAWIVGGREMSAEPHCASVQEATLDVFEQNDPLLDWREAACECSPRLWARPSELYTSYKHWCSAQDVRPLSPKAFGDTLVELGFARGHSRDARWYVGIRPKIRIIPSA